MGGVFYCGELARCGALDTSGSLSRVGALSFSGSLRPSGALFFLARSASLVLGTFAALALLLGTIGLYGVIAYTVGQRTREIGVRMALGAQRASVYRLMLVEASWMTALGITGGILCSFATNGLLRTMLFGVSQRDSGTTILVVCVITLSALLATFIPARRAASIDPAKALRTE